MENRIRGLSRFSDRVESLQEVSTATSSTPAPVHSSFTLPNAFLRSTSDQILPPPRRLTTVAKSRTNNGTNVHVVLVTMSRDRGKLGFAEREQAYIPITEAEADVSHILGVVREKWGQNASIVMSNEPGTKGWYIFKDICNV